MTLIKIEYVQFYSVWSSSRTWQNNSADMKGVFQVLFYHMDVAVQRFIDVQKMWNCNMWAIYGKGTTASKLCAAFFPIAAQNPPELWVEQLSINNLNKRHDFQFLKWPCGQQPTC